MERKNENVDTLVFAVGYHVDQSLEEMIKECGNTYYMIGDCVKPGNIKDAISTAYEVTRKL